MNGRRHRSVAPHVFSMLGCVLCVGMFGASDATAATVTIHAVRGGVVDWNDDGIFDSVLFTLGMGLGHFFGVREERAITEFDLSAIPAGAAIESALFLAHNDGGTGEAPTVQVYGYPGDGSVDVADGLETSNQLTSFPLNTPDVELDLTAYVLSIFDTESFAGFLFRNVTFGTYREFSRSVGASPVLVVEFTAPTSVDAATWAEVKTHYRENR